MNRRKNWSDLPDIITPLDLVDLGFGAPSARDIFNSKGFPLIKGCGNRKKADKLAVRLHLLNVDINSVDIEKLKILMGGETNEN